MANAGCMFPVTKWTRRRLTQSCPYAGIRCTPTLSATSPIDRETSTDTARTVPQRGGGRLTDINVNSWSTLRQWSSRKIRPWNPSIGCSPSKTSPTISEFRWRRSTRGATANKAHRGSGSEDISATDGPTCSGGSTNDLRPEHRTGTGYGWCHTAGIRLRGPPGVRDRRVDLNAGRPVAQRTAQGTADTTSRRQERNEWLDGFEGSTPDGTKRGTARPTDVLGREPGTSASTPSVGYDRSSPESTSGNGSTRPQEP